MLSGKMAAGGACRDNRLCRPAIRVQKSSLRVVYHGMARKGSPCGKRGASEYLLAGKTTAGFACKNVNFHRSVL